MTVSKSLTAVIAAVLVVGFIAHMETRGQAGGGGAAPVSVAVVDLEGVFKNLAERTAIEADIKTKSSEIEKWEQEKTKELIQLRNDYDILDKDSQNARDLEKEIRRKVIALRVEKEDRVQTIQREAALNMENLYRKLLGATETVANAGGFQVVLTKESTPRLTGANQQQVLQVIQQRKLLYANPSLEITQQVLQKMNNDYANAANPG